MKSNVQRPSCDPTITMLGSSGKLITQLWQHYYKINDAAGNLQDHARVTRPRSYKSEIILLVHAQCMGVKDLCALVIMMRGNIKRHVRGFQKRTSLSCS